MLDRVNGGVAMAVAAPVVVDDAAAVFAGGFAIAAGVALALAAAGS